MANGAAVLSFTEESACEPAINADSIEHRIGAATAFAVGVLSQGLVEFWEGGGLTGATRMIGGEAVARLFELQQSAPGDLDFAATLRIEGMKALRARHVALHQPGAIFPEMLVDETIDELLAIVDRVAAHMRLMAH